MQVRPTIAEDVEGLKNVLDATPLFPAELLDEMIDGYLLGDECDDVWLTCEDASGVLGFCFAAPEEMTEGTWNMLAIAVRGSRQSQGAGALIVATLERMLRDRNARVLIADTSGTPEFDRTREFYRKNDYREVACIPEFWAAGDDKVVFWKALGASA